MNPTTMMSQGDIFQPLTKQGGFAELCTALYERELLVLSQLNVASTVSLQRRLKSVPYYVQQAARGMLEQSFPLELDQQNASWQAPQKARLNFTEAQRKKLQTWLIKQARLGVVTVVYDFNQTQQRVVLDSIDRIDAAKRRVHLNQYGWFDYDGKSLEIDDAGYLNWQLARPDAQSLTPALCGHQWNHKGKTEPRTLSLREVLLATTLKWEK
ncbi:MAG TPA: hypothetical protein VFM61_08820 [Pseudidiomarina sp.]|nr:hypothetical protein [Pseudidiomarina sp.]